jgi:Spy/CpxP family protein refolding chaperone
MNKRLIIALLTLTLIAAAAAYAQPGSGRGQGQGQGRLAGQDWQSGPEMRLERMARVLELTDEQKTAIGDLMDKHRAEQQALRVEMLRLRNELDGEMLKDEPSEKTVVALAGKMGELRTQKQVLRLKHKLAVRAQLTDAQRDQWLLQGKGGKGRGGRHGRGDGPGNGGRRGPGGCDNDGPHGRGARDCRFQ